MDTNKEDNVPKDGRICKEEKVPEKGKTESVEKE